jgi:Sigma-70 region 2
MTREVKSVAESPEASFTAFVADRAHALLKTAYALTGNRHAAEDLVQNALAKAYARWRRIDGEPEPYVRRMIYTTSCRPGAAAAATPRYPSPSRRSGPVRPGWKATRHCECCSATRS